MKDLFSLPPDELREIKIEAYNKALLKKDEEEEIERVERETQRYHDTMALNTARMKAGQVQSYYDMGIKNPLVDEYFGVDPSTAFLEVGGCESRSDKQRWRVYYTLTCVADTSVRSVAATDSAAAFLTSRTRPPLLVIVSPKAQARRGRSLSRSPVRIEGLDQQIWGRRGW